MFYCIDYSAFAPSSYAKKNKGRLITALTPLRREPSSCFRVIKVENFHLDIEASESSFVNTCTVIIGVMAQKFFLSEWNGMELNLYAAMSPLSLNSGCLFFVFCPNGGEEGTDKKKTAKKMTSSGSIVQAP